MSPLPRSPHCSCRAVTARSGACRVRRGTTMDNAVALVQAYLQVNGYFTVTEYPVLEAARHGIEAATDLDVLAFRFPGAGQIVPAKPGGRERWLAQTDSALACPVDRVDMLIGEVKEGRAEINRAARDPEVLRAVLVRFGCCRAPRGLRRDRGGGRRATLPRRDAWPGARVPRTVSAHALGRAAARPVQAPGVRFPRHA